jgi:hypothetical protein
VTDGSSLVPAGDGYTIRHRGRFLYSARAPQSRPDKIASRTPVPPQSLVVVPSPLLGYGLKNLQDRLDGDSLILTLEADGELDQLCLGYTEDYPKDSIHFSLPSDEELGAWLMEYGPHRFRRVVSLPLNGGYTLHEEHYDRLVSILEETIRYHWQNVMTQVHMGPLWIRNLFANLRMPRAASPLHDLSTSRPVVVCGAGPSLEHVAPDLRVQRERFFLLAVDTALRPLADRGLFPDAVVVVEAQHANLQDFLGSTDSELTVIRDLSAHPQTARLFAGRHFVFVSKFASLRLFDRLEAAALDLDLLPPLGSVGVTAMELACRITNGPICLSGLDFAYPLGKSHATGAPTMTNELLTANRFRAPGNYHQSMARPRVPGRDNAGNPVNTDAVLVGYRDVLKRRAGDGVFDFSPGGLEKGLEMVTDLGKFLDRHAGVPGSERETETMDLPAARDYQAFLDAETALRSQADELTHRYLFGQRPLDNELIEIWRDVEYCFVHFPDRATLFDNPGPDEAKRVLRALRAFGARSAATSLPRS